MKTNSKKLIVQKYGGATLATPEKIKQAAKRISDLHESGTQVVVVVSAMGQTTNDLIALAQKAPSPVDFNQSPTLGLPRANVVAYVE